MCRSKTILQEVKTPRDLWRPLFILKDNYIFHLQIVSFNFKSFITKRGLWGDGLVKKSLKVVGVYVFSVIIPTCNLLSLEKYKLIVQINQVNS